MTSPRTRPRGVAKAAYLAIAAIATLASARLFYGYMLQQTGGEWSAPLDDVFIHFDYARATARGYPFSWSEGNGYSSGNTSITYPLLLALGYWVGFRDTLMVWAAVIAAMSTFGLLWAVRRLFDELAPLTWLLAPAALFSVGALGWSLWSGMEVAFFLGVWAVGLSLAVSVRSAELSPRRGAWLLSLAACAIVLTRPEGAASVAALTLFAAAAVATRCGAAHGALFVVRASAAPVLALIAQAVVNRWLTGEWSANGAIVKLALNNPYMTSAEKLADYRFNLDYVYDRLTLHHFGEEKPWGAVPVWLSLAGLVDRRTRATTLFLLTSVVSWVLLVALNGQVRWQNERYVMPAVAWLLIAAALGVAALVAPARGEALRLPRAALGAALSLWLVANFWKGERVQYRDQVWFFARACRNIRDQHLTAGRLLRKLTDPPRRVMVGDAGAIVYAADLPAFDLIGLGGYHDLPLARAGVHGVAATLELIERLPQRERPDVMAIYPTWWPALTFHFGRKIGGVPVRGNVICGGAEKEIYKTDWHLLDSGRLPATLPPPSALLDEVDMADLISERAHRYAFPSPGGWAEMRVLAHPRREGDELWDGGRRIPTGQPEKMHLSRLPTGNPIRLVFRTVCDTDSEIEVTAGAFTKKIPLPRAQGWVEPVIDVPGEHVSADLDVSVRATRGEWVDYHLWVIAP